MINKFFLLPLWCFFLASPLFAVEIKGKIISYQEETNGVKIKLKKFKSTYFLDKKNHDFENLIKIIKENKSQNEYSFELSNENLNIISIK